MQLLQLSRLLRVLVRLAIRAVLSMSVCFHSCAADALTPAPATDPLYCTRPSDAGRATQAETPPRAMRDVSRLQKRATNIYKYEQLYTLREEYKNQT